MTSFWILFAPGCWLEINENQHAANLSQIFRMGGGNRRPGTYNKFMIVLF